MLNPCKDCLNRHTACHDQCGLYKAYKAELEAQRVYTRNMTRHNSVYHVDCRDKERNARRAHPFRQK